MTRVIDITSYRIRYWEYKPSVVRKVNSVYAKGNGYIETPEWLQNRRAVINNTGLYTMMRRIRTTIETSLQRSLRHSGNILIAGL
jgi:hypothetical protein